MAMGNIGGASYAQTMNKAIMVGFVPHDGIKEVKKEEPHKTEIREPEEQETSKKADRPEREPRGAQVAQQQVGETPARGQQRRISAPQSRTPQPTEKSESAEAKEPETQGPPQEKAAADKSRGHIPMDTAAFTQWKFRAQQQASGGVEPESPPEVQKRRYLSNLKRIVNDELAQYVKSDSAPYTKRNLRQIASALDYDDPNTKRLKKETDSRRSEPEAGEFEGWNKYNYLRAKSTLKVMQESHQEPPQHQLLLVA